MFFESHFLLISLPFSFFDVHVFFLTLPAFLLQELITFLENLPKA
jgi:hypothetical protein